MSLINHASEWQYVASSGHSKFSNIQLTSALLVSIVSTYVTLINHASEWQYVASSGHSKFSNIQLTIALVQSQ